MDELSAGTKFSRKTAMVVPHNWHLAAAARHDTHMAPVAGAPRPII
jgi:hypothetical protein